MFDLTNVETGDNFAPIPSGTYSAFVDKCEFKTSEKGSEYLNVAFKICGDDYMNRLVFNVYNLFHPKEQVRNIALSDITKLLLASGIDKKTLTFNSRESLLESVYSCRIDLVVGIKKDPGYEDKNVVKGYKSTISEPTAISTTDIPF